MQILMMLVGLIALVCGIGSLVCWVLEIIAAFKNEESPLLGILSIVLCGLGGFIIGWIKHKEWGIQKIMMIWSALFAANIVLQVIAGVLAASMGAAQ